MSYTIPELYIQIRNGQPYEHPILADNFREAFPDVDVAALPNEHFARFIRLPKPPLGAGQVYGETTYEWDGDVVTDVHHAREMTDGERAERQNEMRANAYKFRDDRIAFIKDMLSVNMSAEGQQLWVDCLRKHEAWELNEAAPMPMPLFPYKDENGNWVAPAS